MHCIILVLIFMPVVPLDYGEDGAATKRIYGGFSCSPEEYPFVVLIQRKINRGNSEPLMCGGSLIRTNWVLTAAHCIHRDDVTDLFIVTNVTNMKDIEDGHHQVANAMLIVKPEKFEYTDPSVLFDDIGLVKLSTHIKLGRYAALAELPPRGYTAQQTFSVAMGWGYQTATKFGEDETETRSRDLKCVRLPIVNMTYCETDWHKFLPTNHQSLNNETQLCTFSLNGSDACRGDSGSPVAVGNIVIGIVSIGRGCGQKFTLSIQTRVEAYLDFINNTLVRYNSYSNFDGSFERSIIENEDYISSMDPTNRCDRFHNTNYSFNGILYCTFLSHLSILFGCNLFIICK